MNLFEIAGEITLKGIDESVRQLESIQSKSKDTDSLFIKVGDSIKSSMSNTGSVDKLKNSTDKLAEATSKEASEIDKSNNAHEEAERQNKATTKAVDGLNNELNETKSKTDNARKSTDSFNDELKKTGNESTSLESKLSSAMKKIGGAIAGAFAVAKIKDFGEACIDAYKVQNEAEVKLETVMKQRMGATDESIQSIKDYASELQNMGVVGDEVTLSGAQQLSTFMNSTEAVKKLMPAMQNLAVQQNGVNVSAEAMTSIGNLMGKAMQGQTSALTRVGITFTEAQEQVLKFGTEEERASMLSQVITDNVGEMNEAMAQTDAGKIQKAKNTIGDMQEQLGQKLIPVVAKVFEVSVNVLNKLSNKLAQVKSWVDKHREAIDKVTDVLIVGASVVGAYVLAMGAMSIISTVKKLMGGLTVAQNLLNLAMSMNPIGLVIAGIIGLIATIVILWNKNETFRNALITAWDVTKGAFSALWETIKSIGAWLAELWDSLVTACKAFGDGIVAVGNAIVTGWNAMIDWFKGLPQWFIDTWDSIKKDASEKWEAIKKTVGDLATSVISFITTPFTGFIETCKTIWEDIKDAVTSPISELPTKLLTIGKDIVEGLWNGITGATEWLKDKVVGFAGDILGWFKGKDALDVHSPSKKMVAIGGYVSEGLAVGIRQADGTVISAVEAQAQGITDMYEVLADDGSVLGYAVSEAVADGIVSDNSKVDEAVKGTSNSMMNTIKGIFEGLGDTIQNNPVLKRIAEAFGFTFAEEVTDDIQESIDENPVILPALETPSEGAKQTFLQRIGGFFKGIGTSISNWWTSLGETIDADGNVVKLLPLEAFKSRAQAIADVFDDVRKGFNKYVGGLADSIAEYNNTLAQNTINRLTGDLDELKKTNATQLDEAGKTHDKELADLEKANEDKALTYEEYIAQKEAIETKYTDFQESQRLAEETAEAELAKKKDEIARRQFEADKRTKIANVWIDLASAIMTSFAQMGLVGGGIASGLLTTQAGIQTANINAQEYTTALAQGGIVNRPTKALIGEDGREAIVPLERNTEWIDRVATKVRDNANDSSIISEVYSLKLAVVDLLERIANKDTNIVLDGNQLATTLSPRIDVNLGAINKLRARGI